MPAGSLFWCDGKLRDDLSRVTTYARLLASCGVNAVTVNNVNVHATRRGCSPTGWTTWPRSPTGSARTAYGCTCR
jgi:hypothetical protein